MSQKSKTSSLADKINSLITAVPDNFGSDDEAEETRAQVVDRYEESDNDDQVVTSSIRKQNINLLDEGDERYKGRKVSQKELYEDESSEDAEESSNEIHSEDSEEEEDDENTSEESAHDDEESDEDDDDDSEVDEDNPLRRSRDPSLPFRGMSSANLQGDIERGHAVREQLKMWENILEMRIQLQKCLVTSNQLPQFDVHQQFTADKHFAKSKNETTCKLTRMLQNLLVMQEKLLRNNPETRSLLSRENDEGRREIAEDPMDEEIPSDEDEDVGTDEDKEEDEKSEDEEEKSEEPPTKKLRTLNDYENLLHERHDKFKPFRDSVIQKWNDKTRLASGNTTRGATQPVVKQIEYLLNDKPKLIKRTQLKRSEYEIVGKDSPDDADEDGRRIQEYDPEIYDDDDFYHQLLRELIEQKSADLTDPIQLSKQWIQLQNMRSKMKRKIDTRATKGRRIRYNVHAKLVNFMAPITVDDTWSDLAKNELYNSLFGKIKAAESSICESNRD
ncbi:protein AATF-like [Diachasmimorpha longicaudata]|uniref:protein AATF-like n=1 Tax=Diachasmimorpha longicaudata TaxID=58733 RepID=UPI0030B898EB